MGDFMQSAPNIIMTEMNDRQPPIVRIIERLIGPTTKHCGLTALKNLIKDVNDGITADTGERALDLTTNLRQLH